MARIIKQAGNMEHIKDLSLESLQQAVGGFIEIITPVRQNYSDDRLIVNEEGRLQGLKKNRLASDIAGFEIVGDCVIAHREELKT
jgi:hypothetical protein